MSRFGDEEKQDLCLVTYDETAGKDSFVSIEKAEKVLGYKPKYSNKQALVRNYVWYLENLSHFEGQSGVSHRVPWNQGALKLAKLFF